MKTKEEIREHRRQEVTAYQTMSEEEKAILSEIRRNYTLTQDIIKILVRDRSRHYVKMNYSSASRDHFICKYLKILNRLFRVDEVYARYLKSIGETE